MHVALGRVLVEPRVDQQRDELAVADVVDAARALVLERCERSRSIVAKPPRRGVAGRPASRPCRGRWSDRRTCRAERRP
jgi:hypothetical protein